MVAEGERRLALKEFNSLLFARRRTFVPQSGINMVDLMMWLVIAALLLAAALQSIGYYQRAAFANTLKTDLTGVASVVLATSATKGGIVDRSTVEEGASLAKWSADVSYMVEKSANGKLFLRAYHPRVTGFDTVYLFEACGSYGVGVATMPKGGVPDCGIAAAPDMTYSLSKEYFANLNWTDHSASPGPGPWYGLAVSTDGKTMIAGGTSAGYVWVSHDSGSTWNKGTSAGPGEWQSVASSADGTKLVAARMNGPIYTSGDGGATWTLRTPDGKWEGLASSADGVNLVAVEYFNGGVSTSSDSGATWVKRTSAGNANWQSVASSANGARLIIGGEGQYVKTSSDYGATWTSHTSLGTGDWQSVTSSTDGMRIAAVTTDGSIWTSADGGANWDRRISAGAGAYWQGLASSADGMKLVVTDFNSGYLWTSIDGGINWQKRTDIGSKNWLRVASSGDGTKILSTPLNGPLTTGNYLK